MLAGTGDTSMPLSRTANGRRAAYVNTQIGGGCWSDLTDVGNIAAALLDHLGCRQITLTKVTDAHEPSATFTGSVSNADANGAAA
jgi:hypothetical protein